MYHEMYDEQYERELAWERINEMDNDEREYDDDEEDEIQFADPGGNSSLRAGPRTERCPTCKFPNRLTLEDVRLSYQCDACANALERGIDGPYNEDFEEDEDGE